MRKMGSISSVFSYFIEIQTLNEKCCVIWIICFIYEIEQCHFLESLVSLGLSNTYIYIYIYIYGFVKYIYIYIYYFTNRISSGRGVVVIMLVNNAGDAGSIPAGANSFFSIFSCHFFFKF